MLNRLIGEPNVLQTTAQGHSGTVQNRPEILPGDAQSGANFIGFEIVDFAKDKNLSNFLRAFV